MAQKAGRSMTNNENITESAIANAGPTIPGSTDVQDNRKSAFSMLATSSLSVAHTAKET